MDIRPYAGNEQGGEKANNPIFEIVVVSQTDSGLWRGLLQAKTTCRSSSSSSFSSSSSNCKPSGYDWSISESLDLIPIGDTEDGEVISYCNIEGVSFLSSNTVGMSMNDLEGERDDHDDMMMKRKKKTTKTRRSSDNIGAILLAMVSDKSKDDQPSSCREYDQSVHLFLLSPPSSSSSSFCKNL